MTSLYHKEGSKSDHDQEMNKLTFELKQKIKKAEKEQKLLKKELKELKRRHEELIPF